MSEVSRAEFIKSNFGSPYRLDIRATIGALTMPTPKEEHPKFRQVDVLSTWNNTDISRQARYYHIANEVQQMARLGMIHAVDPAPRPGKGLGVRYEHSESDLMATQGWNFVREGALAVAQLFPDDPQNEAWQRFVAPLQEQQ